jgi:hypothetical protein
VTALGVARTGTAVGRPTALTARATRRTFAGCAEPDATP